jgi:hypothetical protein
VLRQKKEFGQYFDSLPSHVKNIVNDKIVNYIQEKPLSTEELSYELTGLWSYNDMKTGIRIIYAVCEDCRKKQATTINGCGECSEVPDNTIMLWDLGNHPYDQLKMMREKAWRKFVRQRRQKRGF